MRGMLIGFVVLSALTQAILTKPHQKRHQKNNEHPPNGYFTDYQMPSNYQPVPMYSPYQQSYYPMPPQMPYPMPPQMPVPMPQPYPYYMPFGFYPPMYPLYPMYQPYPYYQPYQYQQPPQHFYQDPYAHIPTEIVDVDSKETHHQKNEVDLESSRKADATGVAQTVQNSNVVTSKPIHTTITRTFDSTKSEPSVKIESSDPKLVKTEVGSSDKDPAPENDKEKQS